MSVLLTTPLLSACQKRQPGRMEKMIRSKGDRGWGKKVAPTLHKLKSNTEYTKTEYK